MDKLVIRGLWNQLNIPSKRTVVQDIAAHTGNQPTYIRQQYFSRSSGIIPSDHLEFVHEVVLRALKYQRNDLDKLLNTRKKHKPKKLHN